MRVNRKVQVTKTVADKVMKEMEASNMIMMKATNSDTSKKGTQFVFWAIQVCLLPGLTPRMDIDELIRKQ